MIGLIQRVSEARVEVGASTIAKIDRGVLVLVGVERGDDFAKAERLAERLVTYRVFPDAEDKMNLSVADVGGGILLVPQFTLAADTRKGTRPSFTPAADPEGAARLFEHLVTSLRGRYPRVATGRFGAAMKVTLTNEGPVTFWLQA